MSNNVRPSTAPSKRLQGACGRIALSEVQQQQRGAPQPPKALVGSGSAAPFTFSENAGLRKQLKQQQRTSGRERRFWANAVDALCNGMINVLDECKPAAPAHIAASLRALSTAVQARPWVHGPHGIDARRPSTDQASEDERHAVQSAMDDIARALSRFCSSARHCQTASASPPRRHRQATSGVHAKSVAGAQEIRTQLIEARSYSVQLEGHLRTAEGTAAQRLEQLEALRRSRDPQDLRAQLMEARAQSLQLEGRLRAAERAAAHRLEQLEALRRSREHTRQREYEEAAQEYMLEVKRLRLQLKDLQARKQEQRQHRQLQREVQHVVSTGQALRNGPLMRLLEPVLHACGTLTLGLSAVGRRVEASLEGEDGWFEGRIDDFDPAFCGSTGLASDELSMCSPLAPERGEMPSEPVAEMHPPRPCWHIVFDDGDEAWMEAFAGIKPEFSPDYSFEPSVASHLRLLDEKGDKPVTPAKRLDIARAAFVEFERAMAAVNIPLAARGRYARQARSHRSQVQATQPTKSAVPSARAMKAGKQRKSRKSIAPATTRLAPKPRAAIMPPQAQSVLQRWNAALKELATPGFAVPWRSAVVGFCRAVTAIVGHGESDTGGSALLQQVQSWQQVANEVSVHKKKQEAAVAWAERALKIAVAEVETKKGELEAEQQARCDAEELAKREAAEVARRDARVSELQREVNQACAAAQALSEKLPKLGPNPESKGSQSTRASLQKVKRKSTRAKKKQSRHRSVSDIAARLSGSLRVSALKSCIQRRAVRKWCAYVEGERRFDKLDDTITLDSDATSTKSSDAGVTTPPETSPSRVANVVAPVLSSQREQISPPVKEPMQPGATQDHGNSLIAKEGPSECTNELESAPSDVYESDHSKLATGDAETVASFDTSIDESSGGQGATESDWNEDAGGSAACAVNDNNSTSEELVEESVDGGSVTSVQSKPEEGRKHLAQHKETQEVQREVDTLNDGVDDADEMSEKRVNVDEVNESDEQAGVGTKDGVDEYADTGFKPDASDKDCDGDTNADTSVTSLASADAIEDASGDVIEDASGDADAGPGAIAAASSNTGESTMTNQDVGRADEENERSSEISPQASSAHESVFDVDISDEGGDDAVAESDVETGQDAPHAQQRDQSRAKEQVQRKVGDVAQSSESTQASDIGTAHDELQMPVGEAGEASDCQPSDEEADVNMKTLALNVDGPSDQAIGGQLQNRQEQHAVLADAQALLKDTESDVSEADNDESYSAIMSPPPTHESNTCDIEEDAGPPSEAEQKKKVGNQKRFEDEGEEELDAKAGGSVDKEEEQAGEEMLVETKIEQEGAGEDEEGVMKHSGAQHEVRMDDGAAVAKVADTVPEDAEGDSADMGADNPAIDEHDSVYDLGSDEDGSGSEADPSTHLRHYDDEFETSGADDEEPDSAKLSGSSSGAGAANDGNSSQPVAGSSPKGDEAAAPGSEDGADQSQSQSLSLVPADIQKFLDETESDLDDLEVADDMDVDDDMDLDAHNENSGTDAEDSTGSGTGKIARGSQEPGA